MATITFRWSGLLLCTGAILLGAGIVMVPLNIGGDHPLSSPLISVSLFLASILMLLSLPAMYAKQAAVAGRMGLVGHALLEIGVLLLFSLTSLPLRFPSLNPPANGENVIDFVLAIAFTVGLLLTSIATLKARVLPRGAGLLLITGTVGFFLSFFIGDILPHVAAQLSTALLGILLGLGFGRVGMALMQEKWTDHDFGH